MSCPGEDLLADIIAGRRRLTDVDGLEAHLAGCSVCASLLGAKDPATFGPSASTVMTAAGRRRTGPLALAPGTVLKDTYEVKRLIGRGGMGEVYEVAHRRLAGRYAVKVLRPDVLGQGESLARFEREAEVTSSLDHPAIVRIFDFDTNPDGCVFIAMEYLEGEDLASLLHRRGRLEPQDALTIVRQIGGALTAAHKRGVIHRDLKPGNVFVLPDEDGARRVKLLDFGLSTWDDGRLERSLAGSRDEALIGTPRYMAPEQARGRRQEIGPATDQFALAAVAYELLSGVPAFEGEALADVLAAIVSGTTPPLAARGLPVSKAVDAVLTRALAKAPGDRFPSVMAFVEALDGAWTAEPEARAPSRPWTRRVPLMAGAAALLTVGGAWALKASRGPTTAAMRATAAPVTAPPTAARVDPPAPAATTQAAPAAPAAPPVEAPRRRAERRTSAAVKLARAPRAAGQPMDAADATDAGAAATIEPGAAAPANPAEPTEPADAGAARSDARFKLLNRL